MKVKLVTFTFTTRVVVPDAFSEEKIVASAIENMRQRLEADFDGEFESNVLDSPDGFDDDKACPYNPEVDKQGAFGFYGSTEKVN